MSPYNGTRPGRPAVMVELPAATESVAVARDALVELSDELPSPIFEDLRLLVSELVTNSVRHSGLGAKDSIELKVIRSPDMVRVEVADTGPGFKQQPPPAISERESGWGLYLVEQISDRWGLMVDKQTRVWFELDLNK